MLFLLLRPSVFLLLCLSLPLLVLPPQLLSLPLPSPSPSRPRRRISNPISPSSPASLVVGEVGERCLGDCAFPAERSPFPSLLGWPDPSYRTRSSSSTARQASRSGCCPVPSPRASNPLSLPLLRPPPPSPAPAAHMSAAAPLLDLLRLDRAEGRLHVGG